MLAVHSCGRVLALLAPILLRAAPLPLRPPVLVPRLDVLLRQAQLASQEVAVDPGQIFLLVKFVFEFSNLRNGKRSSLLSFENFLSTGRAFLRSQLLGVCKK